MFMDCITNMDCMLSMNKTRIFVTRPLKDASRQVFEHSAKMMYNSSCINSKVDGFLAAIHQRRPM